MTLGFKRISFFGDVCVLEMFGLDEWVSRATLGCSPCWSSHSFTWANRIQIFERRKVAEQQWTEKTPIRITQVLQEMMKCFIMSRWPWYGCSCCCSTWLAGPRSPKESGRLTPPPHPPPRFQLFFFVLFVQTPSTEVPETGSWERKVRHLSTQTGSWKQNKDKDRHFSGQTGSQRRV